MRRSLLFIGLAALLVATLPGTAFGKKAMAEKGPDYHVVEASLPFDALPGHEDSERMWGIHNNAGYRIEVPAEWNGELIMVAHGYRGEGAELFFNTTDREFGDDVRAWMLDEGYAWAASTYSKNGYNVAQGVKDTHALSKFFNGAVAKPSAVYIMGYSMGGHITAVAAEQYSNSFDAAMPMCGVVGDYELFDYFLDFNLAAQQLALGTSTFPLGPDFLTNTVPDIKTVFDFGTGLFPFVLSPAGSQFMQLVELRSGGDRPGFEDAFRFWNSPVPDPNGNFLFNFAVTNGAFPGRPGVGVDNTDVVYQVDLDPALSAIEQALNDDILRVEADRSARSSNGLSNVPRVSGDLEIPTLTLHNLGDLFVPFHNELVYAAEAEAHGASDLLVQRAINGAGHCDFNGEEVIAGLDDLIAWSKGGLRPAGDDVLDPDAVAAPDFGCTFSEGFHFNGLDPFGQPVFAGC